MGQREYAKKNIKSKLINLKVNLAFYNFIGRNLIFVHKIADVLNHLMIT